MKYGKNQIREYTAFFELNEHGGYAVTVPALPGLVTEGKDLDHARSMAKDAIRCYLEGLKKAKELIPVERESAQVKISVIAYAESRKPHPSKGRKDGAPAEYLNLLIYAVITAISFLYFSSEILGNHVR
jgi:antitoxin HicB